MALLGVSGRWWWRSLAAAFVAGTLMAQTAGLEYQVKAAFLYNFARFVEWPPGSVGASGAITVCALGRDPFGAALDQTLQGKTVDGRRLAVKRLADLASVSGCAILFVSSSEAGRLPAILKTAESAGILTVGETEGFTAAGGMIGFVLDSNKVRFEINPDAAARARIRISAQLLQLARIVHETGRETGHDTGKRS